jgi:[acyl-carrier-protein] S-malonyltransferase
MGKALSASQPKVRALFDRANAVLGFDLATLCFDGPKERLDTTAVSQPAIFVASLAALEQLKETDPPAAETCAYSAGLSLGEYTALVFAGVMPFEDGLRLVRERGLAMQAASDAVASGMVSLIGTEPGHRARVEGLCRDAAQGEILQIANLLCPGNIVVSGAAETCRRVMQTAEAAECRAIRLEVAGAFHTPIMKPAVERLTQALSRVDLNPPRIPVVLNVDARPHHNPQEIRSCLVRQVVEPVLWEDSVRFLLSEGCDTFFEVGPGTVLKGLLRRIDRKLPCTSVSA